MSFAAEVARSAIRQGGNVVIAGYFPQPALLTAAARGSFRFEPDEYSAAAKANDAERLNPAEPDRGDRLDRAMEALARLTPSDAATPDALRPLAAQAGLASRGRVVGVSPTSATARSLRAAFAGRPAEIYAVSDVAFSEVFRLVVHREESQLPQDEPQVHHGDRTSAALTSGPRRTSCSALLRRRGVGVQVRAVAVKSPLDCSATQTKDRTHDIRPRLTAAEHAADPGQRRRAPGGRGGIRVLSGHRGGVHRRLAARKDRAASAAERHARHDHLRGRVRRAHVARNLQRHYGRLPRDGRRHRARRRLPHRLPVGHALPQAEGARLFLDVSRHAHSHGHGRATDAGAGVRVLLHRVRIPGDQRAGVVSRREGSARGRRELRGMDREGAGDGAGRRVGRASPAGSTWARWLPRRRF